MKLVQVGLGGFGRSWADVVRRADSAELVAVAEVAAEGRRWAAETLGLPTYPSLDAALAETTCDAVLVTTPPATHHPLAVEAMQAGKHVLVEKPLATTLAEAQNLIESADATGRILMVSQNYRYRPHARAAQAVIAQGMLGALTHVRVWFQRDTRTLWPPDNFRYAMRHPLVLDMSIHHFDLLRCLTGQNVTSVYARDWPVPDSPYRHPPAVAAVMTLTGGATVVYEGNWATHAPDTSWNGDWEIVGERGRLLWTGREIGDLRLEMWGGEAKTIEPARLALTERDATLAAFAHAVRTGEPPETRAADNIHSLAIVLACVESIETGAVVGPV